MVTKEEIQKRRGRVEAYMICLTMGKVNQCAKNELLKKIGDRVFDTDNNLTKVCVDIEENNYTGITFYYMMVVDDSLEPITCSKYNS